MSFHQIPGVSALWLALIALEIVLLVLLLIRRAWRKYPAFSSFIAFQCVRSVSLVVIAQISNDIYFWAYYGTLFIRSGLLLWVLYEVFSALFKPFEAIPKQRLVQFTWGVAAFGILSASLSLFGPSDYPVKIMAYAKTLERFMSIVLCGGLSFVALFAGYFGIHWRQRTYGIGVGLLLNFSVEAVVRSMAARSLAYASWQIVPVGMLSFMLAEVAWIRYFALPEPAPIRPTDRQLREASALLAALGAASKRG